jgi:hypothetical protein
MSISGGQFLFDFFDILTVISILATIYLYKFSKRYDTLIQSYALLEIHREMQPNVNLRWAVFIRFL